VGNRSRGRQPKTWLDNIRDDVVTHKLNMRETVDVARDRSSWG